MKTITALNVVLISVFMLFCGCSDRPSRPVLHLYTWADYVSPELVAEFEELFNCKVSISTFDSNEAMYAKLKNGASGYDVIVPSSYIVPTLVREGLLEKLDHSKLTHILAHFDHAYDEFIYDAELNYSIPYAMSYTGILYRKDKIQEPVDSWQAFMLKSVDYRASLLDDYREVIGAGLMANGCSLNSTDPSEIQDAVKTVLKWKKAAVKRFDAEAYKTEIASESLYLGHGYSADAFQLITNDGTDFESDSNYVFVLPKEGFTLAFDEMAIMKDSDQKDLAHKFIQFLFFENRCVDNMLYICSIMPHREAVSGLPKKMQQMLVLSSETLKRAQVLRSFDTKPKVQDAYNKAWDEIRKIR